MEFTAAQDFTSLSELLRLYGDADEIVLKNHSRLEGADIVEACREARLLVKRLRSQFGAQGAEDIALSLGCHVIRDAWQVGGGKMTYLAECWFPPRKDEAVIRVNIDAVISLVKLVKRWAGDGERLWFTEAKISQVAIAHELFHVIERRPSSLRAEAEAHVFARALIGLPFSPLLYHSLLAPSAVGGRAAR